VWKKTAEVLRICGDGEARLENAKAWLLRELGVGEGAATA